LLSQEPVLLVHAIHIINSDTFSKGREEEIFNGQIRTPRFTSI